MKTLDMMKTGMHFELVVNRCMISYKTQSGNCDPYSMKYSQLTIVGGNVGIIPIWSYMSVITMS